MKKIIGLAVISLSFVSCGLFGGGLPDGNWVETAEGCNKEGKCRSGASSISTVWIIKGNGGVQKRGTLGLTARNSFTYKISGNKIKLNFTGEEFEVDFYRLDDKTIIMGDENADYMSKFVKQ